MGERDAILVIGAGPAGATAARLLAQWGHAVRLVTRPPREGRRAAGLAESLTPSCGKFFDLLGIRPEIDAAGFVRATGNTVWWQPGEARVEMFADGGRGWQVTSTALEQVMLAAAGAAGVVVERRRVTMDEATALPAAFRLDCSGRAGVLARDRAGRVYEPGHRTVALSAVWARDDGWPVPDPTHTLLEAYGDGWAWSVPLDGARRVVAVMVDPGTSEMNRGEGAAAAYAAEVAKTRHLAELLARARRLDDPVGWDASMYCATQYAGDDWLVVGDAASFVDPLSSAGVKKALASGWLAAIVTHTAITRPTMAAVARRFYADREAEMYRGYLALTRRYLREAATGHERPFWAQHAEGGAGEAAASGAGPDVAAVRAAHDRLRAASVLQVRRGEAVRVEPRPAIAGREIVLEPRLVTAAVPAGVRFEHDIDLVALIELAPLHRQVPDLYDAYVRRTGPIGLPAFLTALSGVLARGWLRWDTAVTDEIG